MTTDNIRAYLQSAIRVNANPDVELERLARQSFAILPALLEQYWHVLSQFDSLVKGEFASEFRESVFSLVERISTVPTWTSKTPLVEFRQAIAGYEKRFSESSIFVNAIVHVQRSPALLQDPRVQQCLVSVSCLRRQIWRIMEHFWLLSDPDRAKPYGIINPALDINRLLELAIHKENNQFPIHFRFVSVSFQRDAGCPPTCADEPRLLSAFREIIRNAAFSMLIPVDKYRFDCLRANALVSIHTCLENDFIAIVVRDNGVGMTESQLEMMRLFAYSESSGGVCFGGRGIGFPTACQSIDEHGGQIKVTSDVSTGTEVRISIPILNATGAPSVSGHDQL